MFHLLKVKEKFRLFRKGKEMYAIVIVCMFIQNCYTCYYGNKVQTMHCADKVNINDYINLNEELNVIHWYNDDF